MKIKIFNREICVCALLDTNSLCAKSSAEMRLKMILDIPAMETQILENFKGGEKELSAKMFFDGENRILHGTLIPGATIGLHVHETSSEIIYILKGSGKVLYDGSEERIFEGMCHYCPKGHTHSLINDSAADLVFFAVVPEQGGNHKLG